MASEVLMSISHDQVERARLMSEFKYEVDLRSHIDYAKKEGRMEGRVEGLQEGRVEIARKLKSRGLSPSDIAEDTGLSLNDIAKL